MRYVTANFSGRVRRETLNGREYLVAPLTLIVPGVLNGSQGALLYPESEVNRNAQAWNGVPLTLGHPVDREGLPITARLPDVLARYQIETVYNATANGRLTAWGWFDVERVKKASPRLLSDLQSGKKVELSTGLFTDNTPASPGSKHNGVPYQFIARNYRPDHLAILVGQTGACSLRDGCGVNNAHDCGCTGCREKKKKSSVLPMPVGGLSSVARFLPGVRNVNRSAKFSVDPKDILPLPAINYAAEAEAQRKSATHNDGECECHETKPEPAPVAEGSVDPTDILPIPGSR